MFEARDSPENMWKVWLHFRSHMKEMLKIGFDILGYEVEIFYEVYYHFQVDTLGHQGSSSKYPSPKKPLHSTRAQFTFSLQ